MPLPPNLLFQWLLRPDVAFLNHGSFGACPREVFEIQNQWRRRLEEEPVELIARRWPEMLEVVKAAIGQFLNMAPADFGLVTNATEGINAILRSLHFKPGDELLTTTHVYNAVRMAMRDAAERAGASYREIDIPLPLEDASSISAIITAGLSDRTRLLVVDHVTSPTALVFPIKAITSACAARGIDVLVDGAHAPGMLDLDVPATGATYYAGNLHKWCCAPRGSGFIWVRADRQAGIHPCVISHNYGKTMADEFQWQGTRDASAWLTIPAALEFMGRLGWEKVRAANHARAIWAQELLCGRWNVPPRTPLDGRLLGSMATILLPGKLANLTEDSARKLQSDLYHQHQIEVPFMHRGPVCHLRVSCQVYNVEEDYVRLAEAIEKTMRQ